MENLNSPAVNVMYEAVFQHNETLIMLDMLVRDGDKWLAVEVKSSLRLSDTYYNDAALQYYVLHGCGVPLSDFKLMYLNADYVKDGAIDVKQLFKLESVMDYVVEREGFVAKNVDHQMCISFTNAKYHNVFFFILYLSSVLIPFALIFQESHYEHYSQLYSEWRRAWQPTPVFSLGESHGQRRLVGTIHGLQKGRTRLKRLNTHT